MIRRSAAVHLLVTGAIVLAAGCNDRPEPVAPELDASDLAPAAVVQGGTPNPIALARAVPGFGGLFLDGDGTPTVYLTNPGQRAAAERALGAFMRDRGFAPAQLRVRQGAFGYLELDRWHNRIYPEVLAFDDVVFTDVDAMSNRVRIGVEHAGAAGRVRATLARLGVPDDAVIVLETGPIGFAATLQEYNRPVAGGLQIHFGNYLCTLGFNVSHSQGSSFVTNSHCTNKQGGTEGTQYYQPTSSTAGSFIGTEADDPTYFKRGACPAGRQCRYSDSSRALYTGGASFALGSIARTASRGTYSGSLSITGSFSITAERADPVAGEVVNKMGRTTGWTYGTVTGTCANVNVSGSNITQLCQSLVDAGVGGGDSGSPVFHWSGSGDNVTLYGILWGGNSAGTLFVFSPLSGIRRDLGSFSTF